MVAVCVEEDVVAPKRIMIMESKKLQSFCCFDLVRCHDNAVLLEKNEAKPREQNLLP